MNGDFNNDGRHDILDDYLFNEVINKSGGGNNSGNSGGSGKGGCLTVIIIIFFIYEIIKLIASIIY